MAATPPSRRRRLLGRLAVVAVVVATPLVATPPTTAGAQEDPTPAPIEVTAVSPWVEPTGTFRVTIALAPTVPVDATLSYTVHQRLRASSRQTLRAAVDAVADGAAPGPILRNRVSIPVAGLAAVSGGVALDIPLRDEQGGGSGELLQSAGIHPVTLTLDNAGGDEIAEQVVFLNRLPSDISTAAPNQVSVTLVVPVGSGPAVAADGSTQLSVPARAEISSATEMLTEVPEAPLTLAVRPDTLDGIARSTNPEDLRFLDSLQSASFAGTIARIPYVRADTAGLVAAGAGNEAARQLDVGQAVLGATTGRAPSTSDSFDDSIDLQSVPLVQGRGARRVVLPPDRFELAEGVPSEAATTKALAIDGEEGLTGTAYDSGISVRLTESADSPGYRAHVVTTDLMAAWFGAATEPDVRFPGTASVILVPPSTDPAVVRALLPSLSSDGPLSADPAAVPTAAANDGDGEYRARLTPRATDDVTAMVDAALLTRSWITGYGTMVGPGDPELPLWTTLVDQTFSRDMSAEERNAAHQSVRAQIDSRLAAIQLPGAERFVLTADDATIPLRFQNGTGRSVTLQVVLRSPRLEFPGGDTQQIVLEPGDTVIDLAVSVQAPGESLLRIDTRSPDSSIVVGSTSVVVSSSRISGVGTVLSILSILVLLIWWMRTHRRRRRDESRSSGRHPAGDPSGDPAGDSTDTDGSEGTDDDHADDAAGVPPRALPADTVESSG